MKIWIYIFCAMLIGTCTVNKGNTPPVQTAENIETVLHNASIATMNPLQPTAQAIAYDITGRIVWVGTEQDAQASAANGAKMIDLGGAFVMPGFQDTHIHALEYGLYQDICILPGFESIASYENLITACNAEQSSSDWFFAAGPHMPALMDQTDMPVALLDQLIPDKPALIIGLLGHSAWANSKALQAVGYDILPGNPQGGIIGRNAIGKPNGIVFDNAQQALLNAAFPPTTQNKQRNYKALIDAQKVLARNGITGVSDAGGFWPRGHHEAWIKAEANKTLTVRANNALYVYPDKDMDQQIADIIALKRDNPNNMLRFNQVKIYVDGIISHGTAALYQPYDTDPQIVDVADNGFEYFTATQLIQYTRRFDAAGFAIHFHAAGDRAVGLVLDAVEAAQTANGVSGNKHRITHLFLVDDSDKARFSQLGVTADTQITPSVFYPETLDLYQTLIGDRVDNILPVASLLDANASVVISSDWDADLLSPLYKIELAITRFNETLPDVETAVRLMTIEPAKLLGYADKTGSLEAGKFADIVILADNIFTIAPAQISDTRIIGTLVGGKPTYNPDKIFQ